MVITVNAVLILSVFPHPMYTEKITAESIYGKKYNDVTITYPYLNLCHKTPSSSTRLDSITPLKIEVQLYNLSILILFKLSLVVFTRASYFFINTFYKRAYIRPNNMFDKNVIKNIPIPAQKLLPRYTNNTIKQITNNTGNFITYGSV